MAHWVYLNCSFSGFGKIRTIMATIVYQLFFTFLFLTYTKILKIFIKREKLLYFIYTYIYALKRKMQLSMSPSLSPYSSWFPYVGENAQYLAFCVWCTSLNMTLYSYIHFIVNYWVLSFLWQDYVNGCHVGFSLLIWCWTPWLIL